MAFRFRHFKVYQDAKSLHREIFLLANQFSRSYWYLADQIKRSSLASLEIALDLKLISEEQFQLFETEYESVCRQLGGLSKFLKS